MPAVICTMLCFVPVHIDVFTADKISKSLVLSHFGSEALARSPRPSMSKARPCYVGPVPTTPLAKIEGALRQYVATCRPSEWWDFGVYNTMNMNQGTNGPALLALEPLIRPLVALQPAARFLPTSLESAVMALITKDSRLNTTGAPGLPNHQFATLVARRIVTVLYHWRRFLNTGCLEDLARRMAAPEHARLTELVASLHPELPAKKRRTLKAVDSTVSVDSQGFPLALLGSQPSSSDSDKETAARDPIANEAASASTMVFAPRTITGLVRQRPAGRAHVCPTAVSHSFGE
eukprot:11228125-Lingulodinium_polyedra.AAC.1